MLMTMYGIDAEDIMGEDIAQETKSYFLDLMSMGIFTFDKPGLIYSLLTPENEELLDQFINNEEPRYFNKEKITRKFKMMTE